MGCRQVALIVSVFFFSQTFAQKQLRVTSPSGRLQVTVYPEDSVYFTLAVNKEPVVLKSPLAMVLQTGTPGIKSKLKGTSTRQVRETIVNPVPFKRKNIPDQYNELTLNFRENFSIVFRAYDDGVAYRFRSAIKDSITVIDEIALYRFAKNDSIYFPEVKKRDNIDIFHTAFEEPYTKHAMADLKSSQLGFSPLLVDGKFKIAITESDLKDYPGMFLGGTGKTQLQGRFAPYPARKKVEGGEYKQYVVTERKNYIARTTGTRDFPWRVVIVAEDDKHLLQNDLVYRLGAPAARRDWSWVKPGISTEEWIIGVNLFDVDFKAGINTESYKYYVDFASACGMQYVMLDAGWSDVNDLFKPTPGMDLEEIARYSESKGIGLVFWTLAMTLDRQLDDAIAMLKKLNCKILMTDFMDRDDQPTVNFYYRVAEAAAENEMMVMFHGAFKNAGFERTFPNSVAREGVLGSEYNIWSEKASPEHDLILPFTRMLAGPMDYEPGFMTNVNKETFRPTYYNPVSMGTRCHQLAMFVVYESPLQLFSGNPSQGLKEEAYIKFLGSLPTTWDDLVVLDAKIGDYLLLARKKNNDWYLAGMTDWTGRQLDADLSFLGAGKFEVEIFEDGVNASRYGSDYRRRTDNVDAKSDLKVNMAPGGGFVARFKFIGND